MVKYNLAIQFSKTWLSNTTNYVKACGKRSVLETNLTIFHGKNPTLTYLPSGKSFALPRFCTPEMQQARQMNKIAIQQAKAEKTVKTYPKASPRDLKQLTSETVEDTYSRVKWTNPNDGKIYYLLKQRELPSGNVIIRILDDQGAFIQASIIKPKKILIFDAFNPNRLGGLGPPYIPSINIQGHGDYCYEMVRLNNPFAKIEKLDGDLCDEMGMKRLLDKLKTDSYDYISISSGAHIEAKEIHTLDDLRPYHINGTKNALIELNNIAKKHNIRIISASANSGAKEIDPKFILSNIEGCGSLSQKGIISNFSSSRNSRYTQHYEVGEYNITPKDNGLYIEGMDILIPYKDGCKKYGKPAKDLYTGELEKIEDLLKIVKRNPNNKIAKEEFNNLCRNKIVKYEDIKNFPELSLKYKINPFDKEPQYLDLETGALLKEDKFGKIIPIGIDKEIIGTSFSTPIRTAKLALNETMKGIL